MAHTKHVIKLSTISNFFSEADERRLLVRGENAVESNRVKSYQFLPDVLLLKGEIQASMRDRSYKVEINFLSDGEIKDVSCTCPRGQFLCHHVAALLLYAHYNISVTDIECKWAAKKPKEDIVSTIDEIYVGKSHVSTNRQLTNEEIEQFTGKLQQYGTSVGFTWLLRPEPTVEPNLIKDVEDLLFSAEYFTATDKNKYFFDAMEISLETRERVTSATIGQSRNEKWLTYRKNRLTASNFGIVLQAIRRRRYPPSLFKRLTGLYSLDNVRAVQWGIIHEGVALEEFTKETNLEVIATGLWLHSCGFLGASPDGLVGDNGIVEVKCPFKFRDKIISSELKSDHSYIVYFEGEEMMINTNHEYYHQIQGNLLITGREICYLWIWTPRVNLLMEVYRDDNWEGNLSLLQGFYLDNYLPYIIKSNVE